MWQSFYTALNKKCVNWIRCECRSRPGVTRLQFEHRYVLHAKQQDCCLCYQTGSHIQRVRWGTWPTGNTAVAWIRTISFIFSEWPEIHFYCIIHFYGYVLATARDNFTLVCITVCLRSVKTRIIRIQPPLRCRNNF